MNERTTFKTEVFEARTSNKTHKSIMFKMFVQFTQIIKISASIAKWIQRHWISEIISKLLNKYGLNKRKRRNPNLYRHHTIFQNSRYSLEIYWNNVTIKSHTTSPMNIMNSA